MKRIKFLMSLLLAVVVLFGCKGSGSQGKWLSSSTGFAGEVLIVCPEKHWKGILGDSLQEILMQPVSILPQYEPMFSLSHVAPKQFSEAYQKLRSIIILSVDTLLEKGNISVAYNQWAEPQIVITISADNMQNLINELSTYQNDLIDCLIKREMKRFLQAQKSRQDFHLSGEIEKRYKLAMVIPNGFVFAVKNSNFCWLRRDSKDWIQSIMVYTQDYAGDEQFSEKYILQLRDSLTKRYVFGDADSSYITTNKADCPPITEQSSAFGETYALRTVGLWETVGDRMGGPFVNFTLLDEKNQRVITIDAFLYAPADKKRDLLRQLEAILLYADFTEK
ncbi:MAG: DUF4837 family protein [Lentimicrobiaceae bacterium]|nr:DUF4837 family protein [Lentimicrobiaceae bacterium]